ncbi:MAG: hypothetical protein OHK0039_15780 [Bacteroidia bacterium]
MPHTTPANEKYALLHWGAGFRYAAFFDTCDSPVDRYGQWDYLLGVARSDAAAIVRWEDFVARPVGWCMGILPYELRVLLEPGLRHRQEPWVALPEVALFVPEVVVGKRRGAANYAVLHDPGGLLPAELPPPPSGQQEVAPPLFTALTDRETYLDQIRRLQVHIHDGDSYEVNLSQAFVATAMLADPAATFRRLTDLSPVPFAAFVRHGDTYLISASPERFLQRQGPCLRSQPIKGTAPRGSTPAEDEALRQHLQHSDKEQAENVMIVDLTRNDLYRCCLPHSVTVPHLFEVQTFPQVFQLVSTVEGLVDPTLDAAAVLSRSFPPGSMTGAPKVMSMELIDRYEPTARGAYAGSAGYFTPEGDFDLNVIIRSLRYDAATRRLSYHVGGAITFDSDPAQEYEETLVKARALRALFGEMHAPGT